MRDEDEAPGPVPGPSDAAPRLAWHHAAREAVAEYWETDLERGLSPKVAAERLAKLGPNRLPEAPPESIWKKLWAQISDFTVLALIGAAAIAAGLGLFSPLPGAGFLERFGDSIAIMAIVVLNAIMGLVQERRAERALDALRDMTAPTARVIRGGKLVDVAAADVVPGDLLVLDDGDRIPADLRLVEAHEMAVEEAALTGESVPVNKDPALELGPDTPLAERTNMVFMGTRVAKGRGRGIVTNTGVYTELGKIAGMLARVEPEPTPLENDLDKFGQQIVIGCIVVSAIVFGAGLLMKTGTPRELFLVAVALAVAAIPEGLPAITTIVLALGTQRMAKRNALVRRLPAVDTLGCAQVICTDKTGTLTQNAMSARRLWVASARYDVSGHPRKADGGLSPMGEAAHQVDLHTALLVAAQTGGARIEELEDGSLEVQGDPTEIALQVLARRGGVKTRLEIIGEQPFASERRMSSELVRREGKVISLVRGAPEALLARSTRILRGGEAVELDEAQRKIVADEAAAWSAQSMRVIGLAVRQDLLESSPCEHWECELTFVGLVGIVDPPRPEVAAAIKEAREAGVRTVMITGDHPATARAIAQEIGLWIEGDLLVTGAELDNMDQQSLEERIDRVRVVARATAEHKLRIVSALRARGFICAMTGDGVNDAPAVKAASIGIAMGKAGADVTKEAAALVLADDNYATIVAAVEEGRAIYANIRKFIFFLLSSNAGAVLFVLVASLLGWEAPLAPIQILWINLVTNGLPALALGVDTRDPSQMTQPPRDPAAPILNLRAYLHIVWIGAVMAATALIAFNHFLANPKQAASPEELAHARAVVFAIMSVGPLLYSFACRSEERSFFSVGIFSNKALWGAVAVGMGLQAIAIYVPPLRPLFKTAALDGIDLAWVFGMSIVPFIVSELGKPFVRRRRRRR